jgi:hypothetical protein
MIKTLTQNFVLKFNWVFEAFDISKKNDFYKDVFGEFCIRRDGSD